MFNHVFPTTQDYILPQTENINTLSDERIFEHISITPPALSKEANLSEGKNHTKQIESLYTSTTALILPPIA